MSDPVSRFWAKVNKRGPGECWDWSGCRSYNGYGKTQFNARTHYAHRVSWVLRHGGGFPDLYVLHQCDNRRCVNPAHLFLGTHRENMEDMARKGRAKPVRGTENAGSKLSERDVDLIRSSDDPVGVLAKAFNVSHTLVYLVRSRQVWKHV